MTDPDPMTRVLVVCTANICRSPLAARLLQDGFQGSAGLDRIEVTSAGTRASAGAPMCVVSAADLGRDDHGYIEAHASRPATAELVRQADLVLTMEREQRSAIARLAPGSQAAVFTLREALGLLDVLQARGEAVGADARSIAKALHSVRGLAAPPAPAPKRRWWQREVEPEDPLTIVDGHGLDEHQHRAAAEQVRAVTQAVVARIREVTAPR